MTKADIVRKFITDNPHIKSKIEIARQLTAEGHFKNIERARSHVRFVTGSHGEKNRRNIGDQNVRFFYSGFERWQQENLNTEPQPWYEPFVIPASIKKISIIADLHSVHLNGSVMTKFLKSTKDKEAVLINGDLLDSGSLSRHLKGHNVVAYEHELEICRQILKGLKQEFNHVYFKEGNHDFWLERYLLTNARDVFKALGIGLKELLKIGELGVHHIHNLKYVQYGDLDIVHGHEFNGFGSKFPSVSLVDKWQTFKHSYSVKVLQAHSHREDMTISRRSKTNEFGQGWSMPCMCRKSAEYSPYAGWDNGWAEAWITEEGTQVKIIRVKS